MLIITFGKNNYIDLVYWFLFTATTRFVWLFQPSSLTILVYKKG